MSITSYLSAVKDEIKEVKWPTRRKTMTYTVIVIAISAVLAAYLGALDIGFMKGINVLIETMVNVLPLSN
jgi:preprotein translocase SecE subunit